MGPHPPYRGRPGKPRNYSALSGVVMLDGGSTSSPSGRLPVEKDPATPSDAGLAFNNRPHYLTIIGYRFLHGTVFAVHSD